MVRALNRPILHCRTKLCKDRSHHYRDISIFVIFKMVANAILDFQKLEIFRVVPVLWPNMCHHAKFRHNRPDFCRDMAIWRFFSNGRHLPSRTRWGHTGTTHDDYLVVSIIVQNLVEIDAVVSIIWSFQYFANLAWKRLFTPHKIGGFGQWCIGGYTRVYGVYQPPGFFWQRILTSVIINKQGTFRPFATPVCVYPPPVLAILHWFWVILPSKWGSMS